MRSHKFLAGSVTGVALVFVVAGLLLAGIGRQPTSAAGGTPAAGTNATATPTGPTSVSKEAVNTLEQRMIAVISDAEWNAAATTLGMTNDDFVSAIDRGTSVADLGRTNNVASDQVRLAMVAAGTAVVNAAVQDGTITQAEAGVLNNELVTAIADKVTRANTEDPTTGSGTPTGDEKALDAQKRAGAASVSAINNTIVAAEISAMASTLGVSLDELKPVLDNPADLATLVAAHHLTAQQLKETLLAAGEQALDQAVANGTMSQADADGLRTSLVQPMAEKLGHLVDAPVEGTPVP